MKRATRLANPTASNSAAASEPTHSPDGVDLTLIRWMLSLTPRERLEALQGTIDAVRRLRGQAAED